MAGLVDQYICLEEKHGSDWGVGLAASKTYTLKITMNHSLPMDVNQPLSNISQLVQSSGH